MILHLCTKNDNHMMYGSSYIESNRQIFFVIWDYFNNPKNQSFEKMKKNGGINILYMCTIIDNIVMYDFWSIERNRQILLSFWVISCPFTLLTTQKIKILIIWNNVLEILSLYTIVPKLKISWCLVPEISRHDRQIFFLLLDHFLPFYPTNNPKGLDFEKWKNVLEILSFYTSVPKIMIICCTVPQIWHVTNVILFFILGYFLPFYPPNSTKNQN